MVSVLVASSLLEARLAKFRIIWAHGGAIGLSVSLCLAPTLRLKGKSRISLILPSLLIIVLQDDRSLSRGWHIQGICVVLADAFTIDFNLSKLKIR